MVRKILRDDQWNRIQGLLPGQATHPGRTAAANRVFVEAVLWILHTGAPGRDLPDAFGNWHSVIGAWPAGRSAGCGTPCLAHSHKKQISKIFA
jgi:transposase